MDFLRHNLPGILKFTSGICEILSACSVPGAGIVKACIDVLSSCVGIPDLSGLQLGQKQLKGMVIKLSDTVEVGFDQLNASFAQVFGKLETIESQLAGQRETMFQILKVVTDLRYKAGIEKIEAAYNTLMKGSHNLKSTLDELKGFIYELNTENSQNLNMKKIKEYLELVRRKKGKKAAKELGSYVVTVKAEYLIIVSLHYSYVEDHKRVQREYEDFNRDAMEIIKFAGLGETRDGQGAMFFENGNFYVGEFLNGKRCGQGKFTWTNGSAYEGAWLNNNRHGHHKNHTGFTYEGEFQNDKYCGQGKATWADGSVYEGAWLNNRRHGHGHCKENNGFTYEGEYKDGKRCGQGKATYADGSVYEGAWLNGNRHGHGHFKKKNGYTYEGEYKNDERCGQGKATYSDGYNGDTYEGEHNDKRCGQGKTTWTNGSVYEGAWLNGNKHGHFNDYDGV
jgi:hypothetical protein